MIPLDTVILIAVYALGLVLCLSVLVAETLVLSHHLPGLPGLQRHPEGVAYLRQDEA